MNALLNAFRSVPSLVDAPLWAVLLVKATAILMAAWLIHLALARRNPRWRVLLWRVTAVGLIALPAVAWLLPALRVYVQQQPATNTAAAVSTASQNLPSPFGRGAGGEGGGVVVGNGPIETLTTAGAGQELVDSRVRGKRSSETEQNALTLTLSQKERGPLLTPSNTRTLLFVAWLSGMAVLAFRLCLGHYRIGRIVRRADRPPQWIYAGCMRVAETIGCRVPVEVMQSTDVPSPVLCGLRRPLLLLPARMCDDSYCKDLPGIFAHELTHVRSHDIPWNVGLQLISIVLWFHPLVWRMRKAHLAACELVCDAVSANFVGNVAEYCRTLARVAVAACASLPAAGIAMARTSAISRRLSALKERVFHLPLRRRSVLGIGFAALLAVAVLGSLQFALAAPPAGESAAVAEKARAKPAQKDAKPARNAEAAAGGGSVRIPASHVMPETTIVEGTVTTPDGKPAIGATVGIYVTEPTGSVFPRTKTDVNGQYRFTVKEPREYIVATTAAGFVPGWKRTAVGTQRNLVDLQLGKGEPIRLRVIDHEGKPMPGVKIGFAINATDKNAGLLFLDYESSPEARRPYHTPTDAEGRWSTLWIPNDSLRLSIEKQGYETVLRPFAPDQREQVITLESASSVSGRVVDRVTKAPIKNFRVTEGEGALGPAARPVVPTIRANGPTAFAAPAPRDTGLRAVIIDGDTIWRNSRLVTNENGEYRIAWDRPNERRVICIEADGYYPSEARALGNKEKQVTYNFELKKGKNITGIVRSPEGELLAGVDVVLCTPSRGFAFRNGEVGSDRDSLTVRTGVDGRFSLPPQNDPYLLVAAHRRGFAQVDEVAAMKEITLQRWARVEGTVTISGKPGARETIVINYPNPEDRRAAVDLTPKERAARRIVRYFEVRADADGRFVLERIPPGVATISRLVHVSKEDWDLGSTLVDGRLIELFSGRTLAVTIDGSTPPLIQEREDAAKKSQPVP